MSGLRLVVPISGDSSASQQLEMVDGDIELDDVNGWGRREGQTPSHGRRPEVLMSRGPRGDIGRAHG